MSTSNLKIAFISGPANAAAIYAEWSKHKQQVYFGTDYLKQFLQLASDLQAECYVVTWHGDKPSQFKLGDFLFDNRPITTAGGLRYYIEHIIWHLRLAPALVRFRPDVLLLTGNQNFWWTLFYLRWFGTKFVISYHAVLWPKFLPVKPAWKLLLKLNRLLVLNHAKAIVVTSDDIRRQVEELLGPRSDVNIFRHFPTYSPAQFAQIKAPEIPPKRPFRVFFMSRIEANKGIYDIVEIAERLDRQRKGMFVFDVCGSGGALEPLRQRIHERGLEEVVFCHGFVSPQTVEELLGKSHACIVPTRKDYEAGFEMTCAEAILAGRPLVTSAVCPALEYMREASIEVQPENIDEYCNAILQLNNDIQLYQRKQNACINLQYQFYDTNNSWYAVMRHALERHIITRTGN